MMTVRNILSSCITLCSILVIGISIYSLLKDMGGKDYPRPENVTLVIPVPVATETEAEPVHTPEPIADISKIRNYLPRQSLWSDEQIIETITNPKKGQLLFKIINAGDTEALEAAMRLGACQTNRISIVNLAARMGSTDVLEILSKYGSDLEERDYYGLTPLHHAAMKGWAQVAEWLLEKGCDIEAVNPAGWTPLHFAASQGYLPTVQLLVSQGANVNAKDKDGWTPLYLAQIYLKDPVIEYLVSVGGTT